MARFRFPFEALLIARRNAERERQRAVAEVERQRLRLEDRLRRMQQDIAGSRQELRVKLQAIGLKGRLTQAWRVDGSGNAVPTSDPIEDISVNTLGFQIRYRYEFAPLSYLYVVYGRGGFDQEPTDGGARDLLRDSFQLRDDEQLLIKFNYRFETGG